MEAYWIEGGRRLEGTVTIHGAKNSVLPILAASVCCAGVCEIDNCPDIDDVHTAVAILEHLGCRVQREGRRLRVDARTVDRWEIPTELMCAMRSSVLFLGPLLLRCGRAELTFPGGCALGLRPIDLHLQAVERLGGSWSVCGDRILCRLGRAEGCRLHLRCPSVGATENAMILALGCRGVTVIENAAMEPEIVDLARFLRAMGASIAGEGTGELTIEGGQPLHGCTYAVMPDRMETATYLCAAAGCGGRLFLQGAHAGTLTAVLDALRQCGCRIDEDPDGLAIAAPDRLEPAGWVVTQPYPGFPTDAQAPLMAAVLRAGGCTGFVETIFENRLRHVEQLRRLGADIRSYGNRALVRGVPQLQGACMEATDLRCGAALVIGALQAEGESVVTGIGHIRRGYEAFLPGLRDIGARVALTTCK